MSINGRVEVLAERTKIPADGHASARVCLRYPVSPGSTVDLKLTRRGSFDRHRVVREASLPVENNEVNVTIYAPSRPGASYLIGEGVKYRLDFVPASMSQAIMHEWVPTILYALAFAWIIRGFAVASYYIPSKSMESTLLERDLLIADKFSFKVLDAMAQRWGIDGFAHEPQRGDVVIFRYPINPKQDYIKRVIGLPGDTVVVHEGVVYINGVALDEQYIKEKPYRDFGPKLIGEDEYFVMGDNRNQSSDSRVWGTVPRANLEGRALFVFWPPSRAKLIDTPDAAAYASEAVPQTQDGGPAAEAPAVQLR